MRGKLYGIGTGPGDSDLLTIKAVKTMENCDIIGIPGGTDSKMAYNTVKDYIVGKETMVCEFSMNPDINVRIEHRKNVCDEICKVLDMGKSIGLLTIGDPTIYSTYMYINEMVKERGYETEIIPGIPSFIASACRVNTPLCEGEEMLHIVPSSKISKEEIKEILKLKGNKVFMKNARNLNTVLETLKESGIENVNVVERCSLDGEQIFNKELGFENVDKLGYFTVIIVKE